MTILSREFLDTRTIRSEDFDEGSLVIFMDDRAGSFQSRMRAWDVAIEQACMAYTGAIEEF